MYFGFVVMCSYATNSKESAGLQFMHTLLIVSENDPVSGAVALQLDLSSNSNHKNNISDTRAC